MKEAFKKIGWINSLNACLKSRKLKKDYQRTVQLYARRKSAGSAEALLDQRAGDRLARLYHNGRPLRILFLGTDEQQDRGGTLQALNLFGDLTCFYREDGSYGQNHPGSAFSRQQANTARLRSIMQQLHAEGKTPHLLIAQTWASFIDPEFLGSIRRTYGTIIINIAMDDRHQYWGEKLNGQWGGTCGLIPHIDLALTAAPECVDWYLKEGCPALFFPEASDPQIFYPQPELPKIHDVSFVGGRYGIRERMVLRLREAGIPVTAYGSGWENGRIPTADVPQLFAWSKIVLGVGTIGHCHDFYSLKMRDFDGPMSGSLYLTHDNPDLDQLYDVGREIVTYQDIDDCIDKARYYLDHDRQREQIAGAGHQRASRQHTWEKRFGELFSFLNLTNQ